MRMLSYVFETSLSFSEAVTDHSFVLRCLPKSTNTQKVMESQVFTHPRIPLSEQIDGFGNRIVVGYCPEAHESFDFYATGVAMVAPEDAGPTPAHPMHLQPTKLTMPDDALRALAKEEREACAEEGLAAGAFAWRLARRLNTRVYESFGYTPGATDVATTASEAFASGKGVCQDYAHVLIALCRECGIPARYVTGLMVGEGATHAWVEVHDGTRWWGLDPTHNSVVDDRYMLFATGRDFGDCPIERGMFRGNAEQTQKVSASLGDDAPAVNATTAHLGAIAAAAASADAVASVVGVRGAESSEGSAHAEDATSR